MAPTSAMPIASWPVPSVGITCGSGSPSSSGPIVSSERSWTSLPLSWRFASHFGPVAWHPRCGLP